MEVLTDKQKLFAQRYADLLNGTEAARQSGYAGNDNVLAVTAHDNLRNPKIRALVDELLEERAMSKAEVIARIADHASASMEDFISVTARGFRYDLGKAKKNGKLHLIRRITKGRFGTTIELVDQQAALQLIGKYHRLFADRMEVTGKNGGPIETRTHFDLSGLSDDELELLETLRRKLT